MNSKQYQKKVKQILQDLKLPSNIKSFMNVISEQKKLDGSLDSISLKDVIHFTIFFPFESFHLYSFLCYIC